jgi:hypothetical protein
MAGLLSVIALIVAYLWLKVDDSDPGDPKWK